MAGLSPKLPLVLDADDGAYALNKTYKDLVKQNFKNLVLTAPGERMMDPLFGVGIRNFLFENNNSLTYSKVSSKIYQQVAKYMPFLEVENINYRGPSEENTIEQNKVFIAIKYRIVPLDLKDILEINVDV